MDLTIVLTALAAFLIWMLHKKLTKNDQFFVERGIPFEKPKLVLGNLFNTIIGREGLYEVINRLCNKFHDHKVFGMFLFGSPTFIVKDPELIKQITIKDFDHFVNHDRNFDEKIDKMFGRALPSLFDEQWRIMRNSLSPIFTSSKMKMMFEMLSECAQDFIKHCEKKTVNGKIVVDTKDAFARYTVDGISTTALGFKGDCIENEDSSLFKMALSIIKPGFMTNLKMLISVISKPLYVLLGLQFVSKENYDFFFKAIIDVMKNRESKNFYRPDVIQLLMQIKKGQLEKKLNDDDKDLAQFSANVEYDVGANTRKAISWSDEDFMAQGLVFFLAGFDTTKNLLQFASYELARNKIVQQELIEEVDNVMANLNGKLVTYEALHKMKFLDQVVSESLRFWPPALFTNRSCNKDYNLDLGNLKTVKIKNGDDIFIPIQSLHRDPRYFENPNTFDPHRFDDDKKDSIVPGSYLPFGYGPRICVGSRFALMEAKLLIFNILAKFTIEFCDKTPVKLEIKPNLFGPFEFKEDIFLELRLRK